MITFCEYDFCGNFRLILVKDVIDNEEKTYLRRDFEATIMNERDS